MSGPNVTIALVDDHPIMLDALTSLLNQIPDFTVVASSTHSDDMTSIARELRPDVLVSDISMHEDPIKVLTACIGCAPATRLVAFTASTSVELAIELLDAGASAFVLKRGTSSEFVDAVRAVLRGETFISQSFAGKVVLALRNRRLSREASQATRLSTREEQIVKHLLCGRKNKEIARHLSISEKTVKSYMTNLMQKLNARNRLEVVIAAQRLGNLDHGGRPNEVRLQA